MRIDASGNLLVSKSSLDVGTVGLELRADGLLAATRSGSNVAVFRRLSNDGSIVDFQKDGSTVGSIGSHSGGGTYFYSNSGSDSGLTFWSNVIAPATSSGGFRDAVTDLGASGGRFKDLYLSGNVIAGNTPSASNVGVRVNNGGNNFDLVNTSCGSATTTKTHILFTNGNGNVGSIQTSGSATSYNTSSDRRLKDNIVDAPSASDDIDAIQVRSFDWKADGSHQKYGMIAQELNTVAPEAVSEGGTEEDMMGVDYSKPVPMLVKEIQSLRARVAQLETN